MIINMIGAFVRNSPFGTEIAFREGLDRLEGIEVNTFDPSMGDYVDGRDDHLLDPDADATIIFKWVEGRLAEKITSFVHPKILYQPDDCRYLGIREMMTQMRKVCDFALTFDDTAADLARAELGYGRAEKLLPTANDAFYNAGHGRSISNVDVCFVGHTSNVENHRHRRRMIELARSVTKSVIVVDGLYDPRAIAEVYRRSKVVLNHATDVGQPFGSGYGYQCRHFEVGFTNSCLLSNSTDEGSRELAGWFSTFDDEASFVKTLKKLLANQALRESIAGSLYNEMRRKHLPEHRAAELVSFIESVS